MKKDVAIGLHRRAEELATRYSNNEREYNFNKETFLVHEIRVLSEYTAAVIFRKEPTGKKAMACLFYINNGEGFWHYFFPTDSHLLGMRYFEDIKQEIEMWNSEYNGD